MAKRRTDKAARRKYGRPFRVTLGLLENEYCCENRHKRDTDSEKQPVCTFEPEQYSNLFWRTRHNS